MFMYAEIQDQRIRQLFLYLEQTLNRFSQALKTIPEGLPFIIDATVHLFRLCFELYWKLLQKICEYEGFIVYSWREIFVKSYSMRLINNEKMWLRILKDIDLIKEIHDEQISIEIYYTLQDYYEIMEKTYQDLKNKFSI